MAGPPAARVPWQPEPEVVAALEAVDQFVGRVWTRPGVPPAVDGFGLSDYQAAQGRLFAALRSSAINWRISDLITLGAPLAHADFLLVDGGALLARSFDERLFCSSPPRPDWPHRSMLHRAGDGRGPFPHFAAPFAAVQWTNVYDEHWLPLCGDVISGQMAPVFGPGIAQHQVEMRHMGLPPGLRRLFTHTLYWAWQKGFTETPLQIDLLRAVLGLDLPLPPDEGPR